MGDLQLGSTIRTTNLWNSWDVIENFLVEDVDHLQVRGRARDILVKEDSSTYFDVTSMRGLIVLFVFCLTIKIVVIQK